MEELGPIRTLICGSSVITVMNIPVEEEGVSVGCCAKTTAKVGAENIQK